jgi:uncharacterized membrane protein YbhN (UPF0104 family)
VIGRIETIFDAAREALFLLVDRVVAVNPWWLLLGIVLYELSQLVRTRGWFNILRAAFPGCEELRARDVAGAYLAGAGLNSVIPARGGDFVKILLVHRKLPRAKYSTLIATFGPETLPEIFLSAGLVIWALAHGFLPVPVSMTELPELDVSFVIFHPLVSAAGFAVGGVAAFLLARWIRGHSRKLGARLKQGFAILRCPRQFVLGVGGWQALSRLVRLAAFICFMEAVGLPVTFDTAILVMAAQSAGRIIPFAPVSAGLRVAMLSYGFAALTDQPVDVASITSLWFTAGAVHIVCGLLISVGVLFATFGTLSPRRAIAAVRAARVHAAVAGTPSV